MMPASASDGPQAATNLQWLLFRTQQGPTGACLFL